ncbi:CDP-glycerol glycerophosphotransferase family protein [Amycolatopsis pigmentata]|uniref:CDP-glycerol glycerophosphotransferase family protein n=1 Tax=Amycolatopsis pigmentata TaxID=450801 RepID=A0ABW5G4J2_9PSEU
MSQPEWTSVPVGLDAERWVTRKTRRTVLVVVHTVVTIQRLLEIVGIVEEDPRIQVVWTRAQTAFPSGVSDFLRGIGAFELPWQQAIHERFDLALAAAPGGLAQLHAPVLMMAHGAGRAKRERRAAGGIPVERPVHALTPEHLIQGGRVIPSALVLSHETQREILLRQCPEAAQAAVVAGDPCYDILRASVPQRARYREALGTPADREIVLLAATWGPHSLFECSRDLYAKALRELDSRRYQVVAMLHPATWFGHGPRQIRAWLREERAAGLVLIEPEEDWRGVVVAADYVIGDHGSATVYAAAIGKPVLHTDLTLDEVDASSPQAFIGRRAPRLLMSQPIGPQLCRAGLALPSSWSRDVVDRLTSYPGQAHRRLREEMYRLLDLRPQGRHRAVEPAELPGSHGGRRHA